MDTNYPDQPAANQHPAADLPPPSVKSRMTHNKGARRLSTYWSTLLALALGSATLAACDNGSTMAFNPDQRTAFVYSTRANQPALDVWQPSVLDNEILNVVETNGTVTFHSTDGEPTTVEMLSLKTRTSNSTVNKQDRIAHATSIRENLAASIADSPETDVLAALADAADQVRGSANPTIVVIDSGLSTIGSVSLPQTGLLATNADVPASVETMATAHLLPDLTGIHVRWYGMGNTTSPQERLDEAAQYRLSQIWQTVIDRAGGTLELVTQALPTTTSTTLTLPKVTPIDPSPTSIGGLTVSLPESVLPFIADEATFLDPQAAEVTVASIAQQITASAATSTIVTGCTANAGTPEGRAALSISRAQAVADLLIANGVPSDTITVEGKGAQCPGRVNDIDDTGSLIEAAARANRVVTIKAH